MTECSGNLIESYDFVEVPADGVYHSTLKYFDKHVINLHPYLRESSINSKDRIGHTIYENLHPSIGNSLTVTNLNDSKHNNIYENVNYSEIDREKVLLQLLSNENFSNLVVQFTDILKEAVKKRVISQPGLCKDCTTKALHQDIKINPSNNCDHPKISVLFSGGLDCAVIAALAHLCIPPGDELDLINVAFGRRNTAPMS